MHRHATENTVSQRFYDVFVVFQRCCTDTTQCATVRYRNGNILGNVNQTTREVTCISSFQSRISQTFTGTVR